ncbi:hypothetical protein GCM10011385_07640 [Nitratireductor aestuarii]|uniref:Uncharacterized protein n=1 Tax=Nitratireductor aestuarii TaxID=1735103 RepID=A0A916RHV0_9HYPH|nr:DUF5906 domain-containing protein [Nitratireductor aestuarii]GGA56608.1 hypothetical protein GCM10011385_07640 [Nitratireductor aestuarii]
MNDTVAIPPENDIYFAIGLMDERADRRATAAVIRHYLVFADDIGTKVDPDRWEALIAMGFPPPSYQIETSPGNETWVWRIDTPIEFDDEKRVKALRVVREQLGRLGLSDPLIDDARYIRMPFGHNSKPAYIEQHGGPVPVRLVGVDLEAGLDIEQAATILAGPDWYDKADEIVGQGGSSLAGTLHRSADMNRPEPIIQLAQEIGLNPTQVRAGVVEAICPNAAQHTSRADTGFAFLGNGLMECNHGHCQHLRTPDFTRLIMEQYDEQMATRTALGMDFGGLPATAKDFLASKAFEYHDAAEGGRTPESLLDEASRIEARAKLTAEKRQKEHSQRLADLDARFALVMTINGVVDLSADTTNYNVLGIQQFTTYYNGMGRIPRPTGPARGLGSAWLDRVETPRYEQMGLWYPGREPKGALNLFHGLPDTSSRAERRALPNGQKRSCKLILAFIRDVICSGDSALYEYVLNWLAWVVQHPLEKPGVNLVLIGAQGTGKGTLGRMMLDIFGPKYSLHVTQSDHLLGRFSGHLEGKLLVLIDEAMFGKNPKDVGAYKARTTEPTLLIEHKGQTPRTVPNHMAVMILSNSLAAAPVEPNDRRATVIDVSDAHRQDNAYFAALWCEWDTLDGRNAFIEFLQARDLSGFDPKKPIATAAKAAMAGATADPITTWWLEVLSNGHAPGALPDANNNMPDWSGGTVVVRNNSLFDDFQAWRQRQRVQHPISAVEVFRRVRELCPSASPRRPRGPNGKQFQAYVLPDLRTATKEANTALGGTVLDADGNEA